MKKIIYLSFCMFLLSCGRNQQEKRNKKHAKPLSSVVKKHASIKEVHADFKKEIEDWKELKSVNLFLSRFKKISPNEALSNALELRDLVKSLKDSTMPKIFDIPSFKARINVLNTETLRLADLTFIPAITPKEVNTVVDKTIAAFSAVNSKINTILTKKRFEETVNSDFDLIGIDSSKMDKTFKYPIDKKRKQKFIKPFKPIK